MVDEQDQFLPPNQINDLCLIICPELQVLTDCRDQALDRIFVRNVDMIGTVIKVVSFHNIFYSKFSNLTTAEPFFAIDLEYLLISRSLGQKLNNFMNLVMSTSYELTVN